MAASMTSSQVDFVADLCSWALPCLPGQESNSLINIKSLVQQDLVVDSAS